MKRLLYATVAFGFLTIVPTLSRAQVNVSINIGAQPNWGPAGYDYVRYYYIPEADAYYDVSSRRYTYFHGNRWITRAALPSRFARIDLYRTHKVVINHAHPWKNHKKIRKQYAHYGYDRHPQRVRNDYYGHKHYDKKHKKHDKKYKKHPRRGR